jgi:hypothetical protein
VSEPAASEVQTEAAVLAEICLSDLDTCGGQVRQQFDNLELELGASKFRDLSEKVLNKQFDSIAQEDAQAVHVMRAYYNYLDNRAPWVTARTEVKGKHGKYLYQYDPIKDRVTILSKYERWCRFASSKVLYDGPYNQLPD